MEWISIKDRVPENTDDVLVIDDDGKMSVSCYFLHQGYDGYIFEDRDCCRRMGEISHWMPLPEPPKEK